MTERDPRVLPFPGDEEVTRRLRAIDWDASPLGPPAASPEALRTVLALILSTRLPSFLFWGEHLICFYDDAYRALLGPEKHPALLGQPGPVAWQEIWETVGPQIEQVMAGQGATWHVDHLVPIRRHGRVDEVYWTYSYSPVPDPTARHGIGGVLMLTTETTSRVQAERRQAAAVALGDRVAGLTDPRAVAAAAVDLLSTSLDLQACALVSFDGQGTGAVLAAWPAGAVGVAAEAAPDPTARETLAGNTPVVAGPVLHVPLVIARTLVAWITLWAREAGRSWSGHDVSLARELLDRAWSSIRRTRAEAKSRFLEHVAAATRDVADPGTAMAITAQLLGERLEVSLCAYADVEPDNDAFTIRADWQAAGVPSIVGRYSLDAFGPEAALALHELSTNAVKYGALSVPEGHVTIAWAVAEVSRGRVTGPALRLLWQEADGPRVAPPWRTGFGSHLIRRTITGELAGDVVLDFAPSGLVCRLEFPLESEPDLDWGPAA